MTTARLLYFSDILCVWAYVAQRRIDQLTETFGERVRIDAHVCSVFPDVKEKIARQWGHRGGQQGYGEHVQQVLEGFPHVSLHPDTWVRTVPATSAGAHMFLKAVELIERPAETDAEPAAYPDRPSTAAAHALRHAFFAEGRDISDWDVHAEIAQQIGIDQKDIEAEIKSSRALAALEADYALCQQHGIGGSPTVVLNEGRQRLFGNVGYRLIEANVHEVLEGAHPDEASWC